MSELSKLLELLEKVKEIEELRKRVERLERSIEELTVTRNVDTILSDVPVDNKLDKAAELAIEHFIANPPSKYVSDISETKKSLEKRRYNR